MLWGSTPNSAVRFVRYHADGMSRITVIVLLLGTTTLGAVTALAAETRDGSRLATGPGIDAARHFARSRAGDVAFAVLDEHRKSVRGLRRTTRFRSASVVKAMMMVSVLRRAGKRRLTQTERGRLWPMITRSDNAAASAIFAEIGTRGLRRVARVAEMRRFTPAGPVWGLSQITAADQVRFFLHIDELVPRRHRRYARKLLSSITKSQRWGIAPVARRKDLKIFFKGGFVPGITHQVALLERKIDGERIALAVLTRNSPSQAYGEKTIEGIAARILR
jgi:beta-lactamase family protein